MGSALASPRLLARGSALLDEIMEFNLLSYSSPSDGPCLSDASAHADIEAVALVEIVEKMEPSSLLAARCYACSSDSVAARLRHGTASRRGSFEIQG